MGDLSRLSVQELEQLQERVGKELTVRLCEKVDFQSFEFCPCDGRSMGSLSFKAVTKHGVLDYEANLGNGYADDVLVLLNGQAWSGVADCLDVPCFHDNTTSDQAKQESAKAVLAWVFAYEEYLTG